MSLYHFAHKHSDLDLPFGHLAFLVVLLHVFAYFLSWGISDSEVVVDESEEESEDETLRFLVFFTFFTRGTFLHALVYALLSDETNAFFL